jgi:hypothetical protein
MMRLRKGRQAITGGKVILRPGEAATDPHGRQSTRALNWSLRPPTRRVCPAQRSVVKTEPPFECHCDSVDERPQLADFCPTRSAELDPKQSYALTVEPRPLPKVQQSFIDSRYKVT